jgi:hypothetical protein
MRTAQTRLLSPQHSAADLFAGTPQQCRCPHATCAHTGMRSSKGVKTRPASRMLVKAAPAIAIYGTDMRARQSNSASIEHKGPITQRARALSRMRSDTCDGVNCKVFGVASVATSRTDTAAPNTTSSRRAAIDVCLCAQCPSSVTRRLQDTSKQPPVPRMPRGKHRADA